MCGGEVGGLMLCYLWRGCLYVAPCEGLGVMGGWVFGCFGSWEVISV